MIRGMRTGEGFHELVLKFIGDGADCLFPDGRGDLQLDVLKKNSGVRGRFFSERGVRRSLWIGLLTRRSDRGRVPTKCQS